MATLPSRRQRVLDFVTAAPRTRQELVEAFPGEDALTTAYTLVSSGHLRRADDVFRSLASSRGDDLVRAWHPTSSTEPTA